MTPEQLDTLGRIADSLDARLQMLKLPLSDQMKIDTLVDAIRSARDKIVKLYKEIASEDPWTNNPLDS